MMARGRSSHSEVYKARLPGVADAGPAGDGDLGAAGGRAEPVAEPGVLRGCVRLPHVHGRCGDLGRLVCAVTANTDAIIFPGY